MHKRGLAMAVALIAAIACVLPGVAADSVFNDVPSDHWAYDAVGRLAAAGLVEGYPDGSFGGERTFTRYEMAMVFSHIVDRLDKNVEEQVGQEVAARSADLDRKVADAAVEARKALAAALEAQSKANRAADAAADASSAAEEAGKQALAADSKADQALRQAEAALDASKAMQEVAQAAKLVADEALALAKQPAGTAQVVETDPALVEEVKALRELANEANAAAKRAEAAAEAIKQQHAGDFNECQAAIVEAKAVAAKAETLAKNAATSEELAAVRQAAQDAADAADRAEKLAQSAAQLEDVAQIAAKANDALALAATADARARNAQAEIDYEKRYRYDDSAKVVMRDFVKQSIIEETDAIKRDAPALAKRVLALEGKADEAISAEEAEQIAIRVVGERIRTTAGDAGAQVVACDVTQGDLDAVRTLVDQKAAALNKDMEQLDKEYAAELQALARRVASLEERLAKIDERVTQLDSAPSDAGQVQGLDAIEDDLAALRVEVAALTGNVVGTQSDVAKLAQRLDASEANVASVKSEVGALDQRVKAGEDDVAEVRAEVAALTGNVIDTQSDVAKLADRLSATESGVAKLLAAGKVEPAVAASGVAQADVDAVKADLASVKSDVSDLGQQAKATEDGLAATRTEVAALTGNVVGTQSDVAKLANKLEATEADVGELTGEVEAIGADVDGVKADLASVKSDVSDLGQQAKATEDSLAATRAEVAALTGNVVGTQSDVAGLARRVEDLEGKPDLSGKIDVVESDVASVKSDLGDLGQQAKATEDGLAATRTEVAALTGNVVRTQSDVAKLANKLEATEADVGELTGEVEAIGADVASVKSDVSDLGQQAKATEDGLAATRTEVAALTGNVVGTQSDVAKLAGQVGAIDADITTTKRELGAVEEELETTQRNLTVAKAELDGLRREIGSTRAELADVDKDLQTVKDDLGPIWRWFEATSRTFDAELVYNRVRGNSLYTDPRAAQKSPVVRAAEGQWYDRREFVKDENYMRYSVGIATEPAPGATLEGRVYADRDIQLPRWQGAGIEANVTTEGIVQSLRIGDLDSTHGTGKFSKYILDSTKWDAQLYRINGLQGTAAVGPISVQGVAGHGAIKRVNVTPGTGNDLAGDDLGSLLGVAGQLQLGKVAEARFSWLNMKNTLVSSPPAPVTAYAMGIEGALGSLRYDAEVAAARGGRRPQVGDITLSQSLGSVYWTGEYGYRGPKWQQRLADPSVDGLAAPSERFLGVEVGGLQPLGFDTKLVHRTVENVDGKQAVWMARAARDMQILVPLTATVEIGSNSADIVANSMLHAMVDLSVDDYALGGSRFVVDAGFRHEQTPLQAEEWDLRWRNASVAAPGSALATQYQNWVADTSRTQARAKATVYLAPKTGLYAGGRLVNESKVSAASLPRKTAVAGVFTEMTVLGTDLRVQGEWLRASGALEAKRALDLSASRGIGEGTFEAHAGVSDGRGIDAKWVNTLDSGFDFNYPVYQNANLQVNGKFVRSRVDDANAYRDARLGAGFALGF
jgi:predicted  nucleic acid-binding Zn-ribbon protein